MMSPEEVDLLNGLFEFGGFLFTLRNIWRLLAEKVVKGVYWTSTFYFTIWGVWNLYYYSSLNQPLSLVGGFLLAAANLTWVWLAIKYGKYKKSDFFKISLVESFDNYSNVFVGTKLSSGHILLTSLGDLKSHLIDHDAEIMLPTCDITANEYAEMLKNAHLNNMHIAT